MKWAAIVAIAACGADPVPADRPTLFGGDRPVDLRVPAGFSDDASYPLVIVLHGYSINGFVEQAYLGLAELHQSGEAFLLAPDGTPDSEGKPFWNGDPACCDFDGLAPDDVGYVASLIDDVSAAWPIDRVYLIGHANGGYLAYRFACERAPRVAGMVVIAAGASLDPAACAPEAPVSVLHLHGTADPEVPYEGGGFFGGTPGSPGAEESIARWAGYDGCEATRAPAGADVDLDDVVDGAETRREAFACPGELAVELWTQEGSNHLPIMTDTFVPIVWPWLRVRN